MFRRLRELKQHSFSAPVIVVAEDSSESFAIAALRCGVADFFPEPLDFESLVEALARWFPHRPVPEIELTGGEILVGNGPAMQALRAYIRKLGATDCNVLITGETGTGKELVARLIHQNSARHDYPLIAINCAAIPDALLESELFGYERGAFTGATSSNQGKLMTANRGTVFFDEIGDMSQYAQAKILRAIESKEVQRLGANRKYQTDVRILAATHHNLDDLAGTEKFRRDLYFRLNVGRVHLPPLRERKSDIPALAERIVAELNKKLGRHLEGLTAEALVQLALYDWPGNIRELKNMLERIFIMRDSGEITEDDLPYLLQGPAGSNGNSAQRGGHVSSQAGSGSPTDADAIGIDSKMPGKAENEGDLLKAVLSSCNGNKRMAAQKLHWSRMTLYRKLAKYGLKEETPRPKPTIGEEDTSGNKKLA